MTSVEIPTTLKQITEKWIKEAVNAEKVLEIQNVQEKSGFLSGVKKAKILLENQEKNIFIKIISEPDDPFIGYFKTTNFDEVEIRFYREFLPKLIEFEKSLMESELEKDFVPKFYKGIIHKPRGQLWGSN